MRSDYGSIKIELEAEAYELFMATRLIYCISFNCIHHEEDSAARCSLRHVEIGEEGKCKQFKTEGG